MKFKTVVIAVAVLVVAILATGVGIIMSMDFNQYRPLVAEQVKKITGRDLNLAGDLEVAVSLVPTVAVNDVTFANAEWGSRPDMVTVERLEVEMALLPLLSGNIQVKRVVLNGADILLETDAGGAANWAFVTTADEAAASDGPAGTRLPEVNSVAIENARLTYLDGATGERQTVALASLTATAASASSPIEIALEGTLNDNPVKLSGSVGALQGLMDNQPFAIDLTGEGGGASFTISGQIADPRGAQGLALDLSVKGDSLADLQALTGSEMPPIGPYSISAKLADAEGGYKVDGMQARLGESDVSGSAGIAIGGPRPKITAALTSTRLDFKDFGVEPQPAVEGTEAPSGDAGGADGRVFPADPLPFDGLKAIDAVVKFTGQQVVKAPVTFENVAVDLALDDGKLTLTQLDSGVSGGTVSLSGVVDAGQATPTVDLKMTARQVEAGALSQTLGLTKVLSGGKVDVDLDVSGAGGSVREIMAGLNGSSNVEMGAGRINNRFAEIVLADLVKLLTFSGSGDSSNLNCMVVRFDFADGLATSKGLVVDTNGATIVGDGKIRLDSEKLDMRFDPSAKETNLVNLAIPVKVGGTLANPNVVPDAAALATGVAGAAAGAATGGVFGALAGLVGTGAATGGAGAGGNPCAEALAAGGAPTPAAGAAQSPGEKILEGAGQMLEGTGDAAKDAGEAIKNLFQ